MVETGIQPSFIPQDAGKVTVRRRGEGGGLSELLLLIAIIAAVSAVALAVAVFLYQQFLQTEVSSDTQQIQRAEADFQPASIQEISRLNDRITAAQQILSQHIAPSLFFQALDQSTLQTVSFTSLTLDRGGTQAAAGDTSNDIKVTMEGIAQSTNSIALESELMGQSGVFTNPIFSGIDRQADGVHFAVSATVDPSSITYEKYIQAGGASAPTQVLPAATSTDTTSTSTPPIVPPTQ